MEYAHSNGGGRPGAGRAAAITGVQALAPPATYNCGMHPFLRAAARALPTRFAFVAVAVLALAAPAAWAQNTVIQQENVRYDYAQVLRVTPVYQTLRATRLEQQCESTTTTAPAKDSRLSRVVGAVKGALGRDDEPAPAATVDCRPVQVEREFRRPIAYDVDYVYRGAKFRSRLPDDPGNRLRIRIAVSPVVADPRSR